MKNRLCITAFLLLMLVMSGPIFGQVAFQSPNWDRGMAINTVQSSDSQAFLSPLFQHARNGDADSVIAALDAIRQNPTLPAPVADYIVFTFTIGLSDLDAGSLSPEVLAALSAYQPATLVAHDDNSSVGVPLFNIQAAAAGAVVAWDRQTGSLNGGRLDSSQPDIWIESYLTANAATRRGFIDALKHLSPDQLMILGQAAAARLHDHPDLAMVTATAGLHSDDRELVWLSIETGDPAQVPAVLRAAASQLDAADAGILLKRSMQLDSVTRRSLAIAELGPMSLNEPVASEALFESLQSRELGAGAALVLSGSSDPQVIARLNRIATTHEGLAQQRATLAIRLNATQKRTER